LRKQVVDLGGKDVKGWKISVASATGQRWFVSPEGKQFATPHAGVLP